MNQADFVSPVVTIAPGVDMAIVIAMCIALDEMRNDK